MDGPFLNKSKKGSENVAAQALASTVSPQSLSPTALTCLIRALEGSNLQLHLLS